MSCALVSITGGVATCSWSGIPEPSSWDFIAVSEPNDDDNYVCYSYNDEETAAGRIEVDCSGGFGTPGKQYVIRYFSYAQGNKKFCDSAPFIWSDNTTGKSSDAPAPAVAGPRAPVAPVTPVSIAKQNLGVMTCALVSITGGVASCTWSGIPESSDSDFIAVSEPKDDDNYAYYSYNEEGTAAGSTTVDCSGGYATQGKQYVIRYFRSSEQGYKKVCDSAPFIWKDDTAGISSQSAPVNFVGPDGRLPPCAHTKLFRFLVISNILFFGGFPALLYFSYGHAQCSTGPPNVAYVFLLLMVVFLTMGEIFISRWLQQPGSHQALEGGYQELEQSESWKIFDVACNNVFTKSILEAKLDHYIFLGLFGRLELSDGNSDALQPGQVRACEVDGSIDASATHIIGSITLSKAFLILAIVAFLVQGIYALKGIMQIRNLSALESELDQAPDPAVFSQKIQPLQDGYAIAAEVAEGVGANVLCRLLEQASEEAAARTAKAGEDIWKNLGVALNSSAQQDLTDATYEDAVNPAWKMMEDNIQTYRDLAEQFRGTENEAQYLEQVKQMEAALEESKGGLKEGVQPIQDYYGTTKISDVTAIQVTALKSVKSNEVVFRSVFNKVLCEAAPSLFLLTAFLDATIAGLEDIAKIKVFFSFALSVFTCVSKAVKCLKMAQDPRTKKINWCYCGKEMIAGIVILGITATSVIRFVGVIKNADW